MRYLNLFNFIKYGILLLSIPTYFVGLYMVGIVMFGIFCFLCGDAWDEVNGTIVEDKNHS